MGKFTVTKEVEFDYGHRIPDHASKCSSMHGHRGRVVVEVVGDLQTQGPATGMVVDFSVIKQALVDCVVTPFDHKTLLYEQDPLYTALWKLGARIERANAYGDIVMIPHFGIVQGLTCVPTAENLAKLIFDRLALVLCPLAVVRVQFWETPTSCAFVEDL